MNVTMAHIYTDGSLVGEDDRVAYYQTPERPLKFDANKWCYKKMPDLLTFKNDMIQQEKVHKAQGSSHLNFVFPQDMKPSVDMLQYLRGEGFSLGCIELYMIESEQLRQLTQQPIRLERVTGENIEDYFTVFTPSSIEYGEAYIIESKNYMKEMLLDASHEVWYYVAYNDSEPVGIVNVISSEHFVEIDGFAVLTEYQRRGIGSRMQAAVGDLAGEKPVILVADAEDTAKDMYIKQGYTYMGFQYSALKE
ncbi:MULTISPECIES: GNAT family N-acetyltransferase [unclassified Staphylococcus]|uniref:GNAT family N-acetyltransferase n=1 Tax=unclassified Staphylococcus TaxID=91994 RepID=UPI0021D1251F|nr:MULTISPECIES: GNAT family N-acetyltransferase [unclassified Staphylococcus]UXR78015.1 GNAT family N-acetyltransferase [Staphylococcus sp. IVB6227]UXR82177.1 GNAT family N-acetyltransferase [Staphylococcus sp. IVB6214]